jgi:putative exporter of polyketide antibiotics
MMGDVELGGVYFPALLLLGAIALILTGLLTRLINLVGGYRVVAYRPLADLALFVLILGLLTFITTKPGGGA